MDEQVSLLYLANGIKNLSQLQHKIIIIKSTVDCLFFKALKGKSECECDAQGGGGEEASKASVLFQSPPLPRKKSYSALAPSFLALVSARSTIK